ncbi:alanine racemase [Pseudidiomarina sp. WS423]|uniref:alanine racemase n=1 Tax=Pseudidiomarina sp. WS423 TaxID=3425124 RepID=UPI003D6DEFF1
MTASDAWLTQLTTPLLLIDERKLNRNVRRLQQRMAALGCALRPHLKTLRSLPAAERVVANPQAPITVSTLAEAEAFVYAGYTDVLYAVGITPLKLTRIANLIQQGAKVHILLDTLAQATAVYHYSQQHQVDFSVFIEIDCDDHRGGLSPEDPVLIALANYLVAYPVNRHGPAITGLMTHAGGSYDTDSVSAIKQVAEAECQAVRTAATKLAAVGIEPLMLSVGSTPTAHFVDDLTGITEVRAGVYTTFDLVMQQLGVCALDDIAMSVVTAVIGYNHEKNWLLIDAGWMALSRDLGATRNAQEPSYGLVCDIAGQPLAADQPIVVNGVNQEHGVIVLPAAIRCEQFDIGQLLRILPNHACATAAMHTHYHVITETQAHEVWPRILGW